ncbi:invasion associated locus B family protein [Labrys monachus]|uniref:Invasion protein IalB n=1 Tax=Labrys monachus TaxID=217067 RepID=A0ABU0FP18_9HYPH|nr:invasion associated locus B family protein [Labrys monachus]MDQ0396107.1 invasion protein IalB [Labrys monachus]
MSKSSLILALLVLAAIPQARADDAAKSSLPGGASSLQESYQDWRVVCGLKGQTKVCAMQQQEVDGKSGKRVLAVELSPTADGTTGFLMMPFGLALDAGVSLALDGGPSGQPLPFKTCLPSGCVVQLVFNAATVSALKNGKQLKLSAKASDGGKVTVFAVSLKGFGPAFDRTAELLR